MNMERRHGLAIDRTHNLFQGLSEILQKYKEYLTTSYQWSAWHQMADNFNKPLHQYTQRFN